MTRPIRFQPDPLDYALVDLKNHGEEFIPTSIGLIMNESYAGCAIVTKTNPVYSPNQIIRIKVGRLEVFAAKIVWVKPIEDSLIKVGLQFLD